jgi:hypothetical protein
MSSFFRFLLIVFTVGIASMFGCSGKKTGPPPTPTDVTLVVPAMN